MQPSPIDLVHYFLGSVHFDLNPRFDPQGGVELRFDSIKTTVDAHHNEDNFRQWNISIRVSQAPEKEENFPYAFDFHVVGMVEVAPGVPEDNVENLAKINGASLLFGVVREQLRILSGSGPFGPIILPSVSFIDLKTDPNL
jgi:preprotein translocase subunit SecB